jgi:hypothetical protein
VRNLLVLVLIVGGLGLLAAELIAPRLLEEQIEDQVRANTGQAATVEADLGGSPFLPGLLLDGRVETLDLRLEEVAGREVTFGTVEVSLEGILLDREVLWGGQLRVTDIDVGTIRLELIDERIGAISDVVDRLGSDAVRLRDRALELAPEGAEAVQVPLDEDLLPCSPSAELDGDVVRLECEFQDVPPMLFEASRP